MSRLHENDIIGIAGQLPQYDAALKKSLGYTLEEIARKAVGCREHNPGFRTAVIPITGGMGLIGGFSRTVSHILNHCRARAFVTDEPDVAGLQEAYKKGAEIIFLADDFICSAFSTHSCVFSDNGYATGVGFAAALEIMAGKAPPAEVLILGAGPVGSAAAAYLSQAGFDVIIHDTDEEKTRCAANKIAGVKAAGNIGDLKNYPYIVDATTASGFINPEDVTAATKIAAPGMPLGVTEEALAIACVFHNPLELGIMAMYFDCVHQLALLNIKSGTEGAGHER
ncbi:MAG: 3-methylornithyl-N6-L-lysine dehydrogenase PylD [Syntrophomonadaceae bacterium]|jgi:pyrrolysine biosynthesis protein PylD|nr:3-methylornithyl-N6-L-lysine dehydrogenase PylD [Syntrophomonadaceae bacterium]